MSEPGESEYRPSPRGEARTASRDSAYSAAVPSFHRYGNTAAHPRGGDDDRGREGEDIDDDD